MKRNTGRTVDASHRGVDFISASKDWAVDRDATIVRTSDGGKHWKRQHYVPGGPSLAAVCFRNDGLHGWAVGQLGTVYRTVNFVSTTTGYAVGRRVSTGAPLVIKTTNGAASWKRVK